MRAAVALAAVALASGCVVETQRTASQPVAPESLDTRSAAPTYALAVGAFTNRSGYLHGAFADRADPLGTQAQSLLEMHLKLTGRFVVVGQALGRAPVAIAGEIMQFGPRATGGVLGIGKRQMAYASVALRVIDVTSGQAAYAVEGAAEYPLTDREAGGFGTVAGYDRSLNGKVLNRAVLQAVDALVAGLDRGDWSPMGSVLHGR